MISVLLPVYNGKEYLDKCLKSILDQSYYDFELLIIDDKSTDNSFKIIEKYSDRRIRKFKNLENLGLAKTLNKGIALSRGDIIVRIDQDDLMAPNRLKVIESVFSLNPKIELFFSSAEIVDYAGKKIGSLKISKNYRRIFYKAIFINVFTHSTAAFSKSAVQDFGGYPESGNFAPPEDFYLWSNFLIFRTNKIYLHEAALLQYRKTKTSYSSKNKKLNVNAANICKKNIEIVTKGKVEPKTAEFIAKQLYGTRDNFQPSLVLKTIKVLFLINKQINKKLRFLDLFYIVEIMIQIFTPYILKNFRRKYRLKKIRF